MTDRLADIEAELAAIRDWGDSVTDIAKTLEEALEAIKGRLDDLYARVERLDRVVG